MLKSANISFGSMLKKTNSSPIDHFDSPNLRRNSSISAKEAHRQSIKKMNNTGKSPLISSSDSPQGDFICFEDKYVVLDHILGEGCSSVVKEVKRIEKELYLEEDSDNNEEEELVVKIIRTPEEELMEVAYNEYKMLKSLDHIGIVKMREAYLNDLT